MVQGGGGFGLPHESSFVLRIRYSFGGQHLNRNRPVEVRVAGFIHDSHPALAKFRFDTVMPERLTNHRDGTNWPLILGLSEQQVNNPSQSSLEQFCNSGDQRIPLCQIADVGMAWERFQRAQSTEDRSYTFNRGLCEYQHGGSVRSQANQAKNI